MDPLAVLDVWAALDGHDVPETDPEVVPDDAVHADLVVSDGVVRQHDAHTLLPLLALEEDSVAAEQLNIASTSTYFLGYLLLSKVLPRILVVKKYSRSFKVPGEGFQN